jgi:hypothetical protein
LLDIPRQDKALNFNATNGKSGYKNVEHAEGGSSRSHYVESSLRKRLWTGRETDY